MTAAKWKFTTLILALGLVSLLAYSLLSHKFGPGVPQDSLVVQVQKLSELATVRCRIQRIVALTEQKQPLGEESILLMVEGEVKGGINLQRVTQSDVTTDDTGRLTITLPAPTMLSTSLDESKTKIWDRHVTWWTPWVSQDPDLEHKARLQALEEVRKAALDLGILEEARSNAQSALRDLFGTLGWKVTVKIRGLD